MAAEAILGAFMQTLFQKLSEALLDHFKSCRGIHSKLESLSQILSQLQAFLDDAEAKQLADASVRGWLAKLKDVAYDLDDLLDRYTAKIMYLKKRKVKLSTKASVGSPSSFLHRNLYQYRIKRKISGILERLDKIARERNTIGLQMLGEMSRRETPERPQSSSLVDSSALFGREGDREEMVRLMLSDNGHSSCNVCVIPVVGMGGLGKTTLMQMVYNDDRVKEHFELRIWIYVSECFDGRKLTQETLEAAAYDQSFPSTNMNMLQETLSRVLRGKRYLLVLDDVWNEDYDKWLSYRAALISGGLGSKIVVTTRNENVGRIMGGLEPYKLQQLSDDDSWSVFKSHAFRDGDCSTYPQLEVIGRQIVKKLKGLPLASKALGSLLFCKADEEEWKGILRSDIWELPADKNNILPALRLSYNHLPPHLKQCFAFCSVYPKDYIFSKEKLVKIWLALGFIRQSRKKIPEDSGNADFNELVSRSFFQPYKENYVMHDAMHDLAISVSMEHCERFEDGTRYKNAIKTRHLSFPCTGAGTKHFDPLYGFRKLRTLILMHGYNSKISRFPDGVFMKLQFLRVLDMHGRGLKELPESIGNLKQLRFLDLSSTEIKTLPASIVKLYNLQIMKLNNCSSLREVPHGITKLTNLRHLEGSTRLLSRIPGIGNLICLQELEEFVVLKRPGHNVTELRNMDQLQGKLTIRGLNNVADEQDAICAKLKTKEHLRALHFIWDEDCKLTPSDPQDEVLEGLQPHIDLKELMVKGFPGARFPSWLATSFLPNLQTTHICNCRCTVLPPLGQLPFLKNLNIAGATEVTQIGREFTGLGQIKCFPALEELLLEDMPKLGEWIFYDADQLFPQLTELGLINCPKLKKLPPVPPTLTTLRIDEAGLESLPDLQKEACPSSLTFLYINGCPNLTSLRVGLLSHNLTALKSLTVAHCEELVSLPEECFRPLTSLQFLHIYECPCLVPWTALERGLLPASVEEIRLVSCSLLAHVLLDGLQYLPRLKHFQIADYQIADYPDISNFPLELLPHTLQFLDISRCDDLQCLPPSLHKVSSLETLHISNCRELESLPEEGLPRGLKELYINQCPKIKQRCQEGGQDRVKIAHIRDIEIDGDVIVLEQI
uniref:Disease resistance protein RGA3 n=2 Tax=Triticum urartu TaxID=4572 RepID=A0A8R7PUI4_TRIUA